MKIALLPDIHYGIRNDALPFLDNLKQFFDKTFFPYLEKHNIKTIVQLGDLVDRRRYINFNTANRLRKDFVDPLINGGYDFHWILGNHDLHLRQENTISAAEELFWAYRTDNFKFYINPEEVQFDGLNVLFLPWICDSNRDISIEAINTTKAQIVFGHLELSGFEYLKGVMSHSGDDPQTFSKFDVVCSGHYHHRSTMGSVHYLGAVSEHNWGDCGDPRGFDIFDTVSRDLDFIQNPHTLFVKLFYNDSTNKYKEIDFSSLTNKFVKVVVTNRSKQKEYDWFLSKIEESCPLDYTIVQDHLNLNLTDDETIVSETKSTLEIIREFVASRNNAVNQIKLDTLFVELYKQAQEIES